jgi:menaquinol-cytochrome c reductase iron-sulfur subunit
VADQEEGTPEVPSPDGPRHPLPAASLWPFGFAAGIALILIGVVISWPVFGIGCGIAALFGFAWAYDVVRGGKPAAVPVDVVETEEDEEETAERYGRNVFLERTTLGLGAVIGAIVTVPIVGFAVAPAFVDQADEDIDLGPLSNYPEGQFLVATFQSRAGEGSVSTRTAFVRNNGFVNDVPSFTIISNRCAHLGCPTQPGGPTRTEEAREIETDSGTVRLIPSQPASFICPCHGGAYDSEGNRTAGPPVRGLDRYLYSIVGGNLVLGLRYSVGRVEGTGAEARIIGYTRYDPGQHVDGPTDWLYPISPHEIYD